MSRTILHVQSLGMTYVTSSGPRQVLEGLSLDVAAGEIVCVVGPSGVGKTTLMRCLAGLQRPTAGEVRLEGSVVLSPPAGLSVVFQDYGRSLFPWMRVLDNVALPLRAAGVGKDDRRMGALDALGEVGLEDTAHQYPWQLSGGMQQRVAIARSLASSPEILLMDEPFASVDAQTRFELEDLTRRICADTGVSIVLVTHDIDEAVYLGDRVVVLSGAPAHVTDVIRIRLGAERDQLSTRADLVFVDTRTAVLAAVRGGRAAHAHRADESVGAATR
jgi:NitT/TauT family transport system ATP-binding protein